MQPLSQVQLKHYTLLSSETLTLTTRVDIDPVGPISSSRDQHPVRVEDGACDRLRARCAEKWRVRMYCIQEATIGIVNRKGVVF